MAIRRLIRESTVARRDDQYTGATVSPLAAPPACLKKRSRGANGDLSLALTPSPRSKPLSTHKAYTVNFSQTVCTGAHALA